MRKKKIQILLSAAAFLFLMEGSVPSFAQERKIGQVERKADRNFVRQRFDKAMSQYETAVKGEKDADSQAALHLKMGRLYFMIREYKGASEHYGKAMELRPDMLGVNDVCEYIDALRFQGLDRQAEAICLNNAYKDAYSRYQRYQNTLEALAMRHSIQDDPGFLAKRLSLNTDNAEYWIGVYDDQPFYAISYSKFNDPGKLFFHRTHYYALNETDAPGASQKPPKYSDYFRKIPADLQNGPLSFSPDMRMMVTTVIEYDKEKTTIEMVEKNFRPFRTKLFYSTLKNKKRRFSKYEPIFAQEPTASYAHPYILDDGKALLFTSDMPGGYGGFDLYITRWDEVSQTWGTPVNLGPEVNTEGDEIFPVVYKGRLIFSSNGLPGFGGYDLFSVFFDRDGVVPGTVNHFPYPVNSVFNDYYMCPIDLRTAYFASDREAASKDDIYFLRTVEDLGTPQQGNPFFGMNEMNAILGGALLLNGATEAVSSETVTLKQYAPEGLLMTLYFDFDSDKLTGESILRLERFVDEMGTYQFSELRFDGFADEMGSDAYNYALSERRAEQVAAFLRSHGVDVKFNIQAHGRTKLSPEEVKEEIGSYRWTEESIDWIRVNRRARRVEIYNKR